MRPSPELPPFAGKIRTAFRSRVQVHQLLTSRLHEIWMVIKSPASQASKSLPKSGSVSVSTWCTAAFVTTGDRNPPIDQFTNAGFEADLIEVSFGRAKWVWRRRPARLSGVQWHRSEANDFYFGICLEGIRHELAGNFCHIGGRSGVRRLRLRSRTHLR